MKKLLLLLLTMVLLFSFAACQSKPVDKDPNGNNQNGETGKNDNLEGSLEDILAKIYETAEVSDQFREYMEAGLQTMEITAEKCAYYLGKEGIEFEEALASVPIMSSSAYELDLVRVKKGADIEQIKKDIKDNVDPMKWICVGVDSKNIIVDNIGDIIILIMSDDEAKALHDAFLALKN